MIDLDAHHYRSATEMTRAALLIAALVMTAPPLTYGCLYQCGKRVPSSLSIYQLEPNPYTVPQRLRGRPHAI